MDTRKFDTLFDSGRDITEYLILDKATRPSQQPKRINVDFPSWIVLALDKEAKRIGITRQSLIKVWLAERLEKQNN